MNAYIIRAISNGQLLYLAHKGISPSVLGTDIVCPIRLLVFEAQPRVLKNEDSYGEKRVAPTNPSLQGPCIHSPLQLCFGAGGTNDVGGELSSIFFCATLELIWRDMMTLAPTLKSACPHLSPSYVVCAIN
jgi:hypothetical protein